MTARCVLLMRVVGTRSVSCSAACIYRTSLTATRCTLAYLPPQQTNTGVLHCTTRTALDLRGCVCLCKRASTSTRCCVTFVWQRMQTMRTFTRVTKRSSLSPKATSHMHASLKPGPYSWERHPEKQAVLAASHSGSSSGGPRGVACAASWPEGPATQPALQAEVLYTGPGHAILSHGERQMLRHIEVCVCVFVSSHVKHPRCSSRSCCCYRCTLVCTDDAECIHTTS